MSGTYEYPIPNEFQTKGTIRIQNLKMKVRVMVLNATFNNISVISWWSAFLEKKTTELPRVTDKLYHIMLYPVLLAMSENENKKQLITV